MLPSRYILDRRVSHTLHGVSFPLGAPRFSIPHDTNGCPVPLRSKGRDINAASRYILERFRLRHLGGVEKVVPPLRDSLFLRLPAGAAQNANWTNRSKGASRLSS